jgi:hypothetical protein
MNNIKLFKGIPPFYPIRAVKIGALPTRMVPEQANFRKGISRKKNMYVFQVQSIPIQCAIQQNLQ